MRMIHQSWDGRSVLVDGSFLVIDHTGWIARRVGNDLYFGSRCGTVDVPLSREEDEASIHVPDGVIY